MQLGGSLQRLSRTMSNPQVFSPRHTFTGNPSFQNGLLQVVISGGVAYWYAYESLTTNAWVNIGPLLFQFTGALNASIVHTEILKLSPDVIQWREIRMNGTNRLGVTYTLRRGACHCKVVVETKSLGIGATGIFLSKTGGYMQMFNPSTNGASGSGNLALSATDSYECGYNTTDKIVAGFVLLDQPGYQPIDSGGMGHVFQLSLAIGTNTTKTFFIFAFPHNTASFDLSTARYNASIIAAQTRYALDEKVVVVPRSRFL